MNSFNRENDQIWFSNLFKCATLNTNLSTKGPVTISTTPSQAFDREILENLGIRAILSSGIGDHNYHDRIFSSRITLPKIHKVRYEALIFNFIVRENEKLITLNMNSKCLTLLILVYPKQFRRYINRFEEDLEILLSQKSILPSTISEIFDEKELKCFLHTLRNSIIMFENEILLDFEEFTVMQRFDEELMATSSKTYLNDLL